MKKKASSGESGQETGDRGQEAPQAASLKPQAHPALRVIGIDAATTKSGYAAIDIVDGNQVLVECGVAKAKAKAPMNDRLEEMFTDLGALVAEFVEKLEPPARVIVAIERGYVSPETLNNALPMGMAFCCAVLAAGSARSDLKAGVTMEIVEVSPGEVKVAGCGKGNANKEAMREGVMRRLSLNALPPEDAADACAVAMAGWKKAGQGSGTGHQAAVKTRKKREPGGSGKTKKGAVTA